MIMLTIRLLFLLPLHLRMTQQFIPLLLQQIIILLQSLSPQIAHVFLNYYLRLGI